MSNTNNSKTETTAELVLKARRGQRAVSELKSAFDRECARRMKALRRIEDLGYQSLDEEHATNGATLLNVPASLDPEHRAMLDAPTTGLTPATL